MPLTEVIKARLEATDTWYEIVPGSDWIKVKCINPDHDDSNPSGGINRSSGIFHCFSCQFNSMFIQEDTNHDDADIIWQAKYANMKKSMQNEYPDYDSIHETILDRNKQLFLPPVDHMLTEAWRGLSPELLADCGAYYCSHGKYRGRYVFPVYMDGQNYGFDARIVDASAQITGAKWVRPRGMPVKYIVYPKDVITKRFPDTEHIVVAEGVADALSYIEMGIPAIASFGLTPPNSSRIEELLRMGITKITLAFDHDAAGMAGMLKVLPYYSEWFEIVPHQMVNLINASEYKDANDFLVGVRTNGLKTVAQDSWDDEEGDL